MSQLDIYISKMHFKIKDMQITRKLGKLEKFTYPWKWTEEEQEALKSASWWKTLH